MRPLKIFRSVAAIGSAVALFSCSQPPEKTIPDAAPYYDFKGFIEGEMKTLPGSGYTVHKYLEWDGKKEEIIQPAAAINWEKELAWFLELDMSKPAYTGLYTTDTLENDSNRLAVSYRPDYGHIPHRPELIGAHYTRLEDGNMLIGGVIYKDNAFSTEEVTLSYWQGRQYAITGHQEIKRTGIRHRFYILGKLAPVIY